MRADQLTKYDGQTVVLDLVNGKEITTRIKQVNPLRGTVTCIKPRMFIPMSDPRNPQGIQVSCVVYGQPLYTVEDEIEIETSHIITVFKSSEEQTAAYNRYTSGLIQPPGGGGLVL